MSFQNRSGLQEVLHLLQSHRITARYNITYIDVDLSDTTSSSYNGIVKLRIEILEDTRKSKTLDTAGMSQGRLYRNSEFVLFKVFSGVLNKI